MKGKDIVKHDKNGNEYIIELLPISLAKALMVDREDSLRNL